MVPANVYRTRDGGWIALSGAGDQPFARLCEAIDAPDAVKDPRFATSAARLANRAAADALVGGWVGRHDLVDVEARFTAGVAGTAVRSVDEIIGDAHVAARESLLRLTSQSGRDLRGPRAHADVLAHERARRGRRAAARRAHRRGARGRGRAPRHDRGSR